LIKSFLELREKESEREFLPTKVPSQKGRRGTSMMGAAMLMNQLGRNGVIRRKMM